MKLSIHSIGLLFSSLLLAGTVYAETLDIPAEPPTQTSTAAPGKGLSMDQVETRFGSPQEKIPAVGDPPISRWVYGNFTVYFEYEHVIHSVYHLNN